MINVCVFAFSFSLETCLALIVSVTLYGLHHSSSPHIKLVCSLNHFRHIRHTYIFQFGNRFKWLIAKLFQWKWKSWLEQLCPKFFCVSVFVCVFEAMDRFHAKIFKRHTKIHSTANIAAQRVEIDAVFSTYCILWFLHINKWILWNVLLMISNAAFVVYIK